MKIGLWSFPWYYGYNTEATLGRHLRFAWTGSTGNLLAYKSELGGGQTLENCVISDASEIFSIDTKLKKI